MSIGFASVWLVSINTHDVSANIRELDPLNVSNWLFYMWRDGTSMGVIRKQRVVEPYEKYQSNGNPCRKGPVPFHIESHFNTLAPLPVGFDECKEIRLAKAADASLTLLCIALSFQMQPQF
jgi:hypothetical protein